MTPQAEIPKNIPYHDVFMGTIAFFQAWEMRHPFGGVRGTPRNSSACKQQQGRYTNYCCNPYGKAAPHHRLQMQHKKNMPAPCANDLPHAANASTTDRMNW
ncbi:hypothetical protein TNCV_3154381 [Trichonephila clavipes]|nr:hypothetical protein TNCV_3154381 [Trichonephila clavipes]